MAEVALLSVLILATRCANYEDVFVNGQIYFVDADCYARMTRARLVAQHPGLIVRHHEFENYPPGITPHTTAPLDYLIVGLAAILSPVTGQPLDLAGALVSPLLALSGGWFLWWWTRRLGFRYRWAALLLFALSPILAHGTALGRPDHQALLIVLVLIALAAEWSLHEKPSRGWGIVSGLSWGLALWVSLYEPLLLLGAVVVGSIVLQASALGRETDKRGKIFGRERRIGWWICGGVLLLAGLLERRWPQLPDPGLRAAFLHWSATVGELQTLGLTSVAWWEWFGALLPAAPILFVFAWQRRRVPPAFVFLFLVTFLLTLWQARWGYFLAVVFALTIPALLEAIPRRSLGVLAFLLALLPVFQFWDEAFWPHEERLARRTEARREALDWRAAASSLPHDRPAPFLAPWWLSPAAAYWSGEPAVAGSSHESLPGIVASARFFLATRPEAAREILRQHRVQWVLVYDAGRVAQNSAAILGESIPPGALCFTLDRTPSRAPAFLQLAGQNNSAKLYRVRD